jgi:hypothetical protein
MSYDVATSDLLSLHLLLCCQFRALAFGSTRARISGLARHHVAARVRFPIFSCVWQELKAGSCGVAQWGLGRRDEKACRQRGGTDVAVGSSRRRDWVTG